MAPNPKLVERYVQKILATLEFPSGGQLVALLRYLVDAELEGKSDRVKGYSIGVDVLGRDSSFDPNSDAIVRVQVGRLRKALNYYYATVGANDRIRIEIPKGAYRAVFTEVDAGEAEPARGDAGDEPVDRSTDRVFATDAITVGVMPFMALTGEPDKSAFADALSDSLTTMLARARSLALAPRSSTFQFRDPTDLRRVGEALNVRYIVDGTVRQMGKQLRVNVQLIDAVSLRHLWAHQYDRTVEDLFAVQDDLVTHMAAELRMRLYIAAKQAVRNQSDDTYNAWDLFIQSSWTPDERINSLKQELEHVDQARRALELDPRSGKAHSVLAEKMAYLANVDPESDTPAKLAEAHSHGRRAIELEPADADVVFNVLVHHWHSGRLDAAISAARRTLELEPTHLVARILEMTIPYTSAPAPPGLFEELHALGADIAPDNAARWVLMTWICRLHLNDANYEPAVEYGWRTHEIYATPDTRNRLCAALVQLGDADTAVELIDQAREDWPTFDLYHYANVATPRRHGAGPTAQHLVRLYRDLADAYKAQSRFVLRVV